MENIETKINEFKYQFKNLEEVQLYINQIIIERELVEREIPGLWLDIKYPQHNLDKCFNQDGNPIGDYRVSPYTKRVIKKIMNKSRKKGAFFSFPILQGKVYIQTNPSFLTNSDLDGLSNEKSIIKRINDTNISFYLSNFKYSLDKRDISPKKIVDSYKDELDNSYSEIEDMLDYYDNQLAILYRVRKELEYEDIRDTYKKKFKKLL